MSLTAFIKGLPHEGFLSITKSITKYEKARKESLDAAMSILDANKDCKGCIVCITAKDTISKLS